MSSIIRISPVLGTMLAAAIAHGNPEYAAKHGIEGLWTYQDSSKLPEDCQKLGTKSFVSSRKNQTSESALEDRFRQHALIAHQLNANYTVANQDYSFVEYYRCRKSS